MKKVSLSSVCVLAAMSVLGAGCRRDANGTAGTNGETHDDAPAPTNRVNIPASVRQNLGVTFARVERRAVSRTLRVPGRFELLPDARREYRAMLAGEAEPVVAQFDRVERGDVLYRLRSPRWRELQQQIAEAEAAIRSATASSDTIGPLRNAHRVHETALEETVNLWTQRIAQLEEIRRAGGGKADELAEARATLTGARAALAEVVEKDAELEAREREIAAQLDAANARRELLLATASTLTGMDIDGLTATGGSGSPRWRLINTLEIRAVAPGTVESIGVSPGAWVEESSLVMSTLQPERIRFHAHGLQSDLSSLRSGLAAQIVPPAGASWSGNEGLQGSLVVGPLADADDRTIDLYLIPADLAPWAKPGVAAFLEVTLAGAGDDLAVPLGSIVRDSLTPILFRRDPNDPDSVIRLDADVGIDDGRWIVVKSGVREGDQVVLDGVYQLMLATSGTAARGGHFHADGTYHAGEDK